MGSNGCDGISSLLSGVYFISLGMYTSTETIIFWELCPVVTHFAVPLSVSVIRIHVSDDHAREGRVGVTSNVSSSCQKAHRSVKRRAEGWRVSLLFVVPFPSDPTDVTKLLKSYAYIYSFSYGVIGSSICPLPPSLVWLLGNHNSSAVQRQSVHKTVTVRRHWGER
jgi:hypothetical protein